MSPAIFKFLKTCGYEPLRVDRLIISAFVEANGYKVKKNKLVGSYLIKENDVDYDQLTKFNKLLVNIGKFDFERLIELFEFVISPIDKKVNGAVYTPKYIRSYILNQTLKKLLNRRGTLNNDVLVADIACGCGGFLFDAARLIKQYSGNSYSYILQTNIYGLDIQDYSIIRTKLLLSLLALSDGEDITEITFGLFCGNALDFNWTDNVERFKRQGGFDIIVGNPPYVGVSKMDAISRSLLKNWSVTLTGKPDLYIPFFQIAVESLNLNGIMGYITVNTFYKSINGRALREYFASNRLSIQIIDFAGEQVFKGRSTYTCICIVKREPNSQIKYIKSGSLSIAKLKDRDFLRIGYESLNNFDGWLLESRDAITNITKIEQTGTPLGKLFQLRNGFATLQNDIYVFTPIDENKFCYKLLMNNKEYWVEKEICRDAIKPNILKSESDISRVLEKLIFPYKVFTFNDLHGQAQSKLSIVDETVFKTVYPKAYKYLLDHQVALSTRDNGNKGYERWYAFGRNQALTIKGFKLLFPYIAERPYFVFTDDKDLLFYNGFAVISESKEELLVLQKILSSRLFWYYITHSSKPYGNNYYSLGVNYIKRFGICKLSEAEKEELLTETNQTIIDRFLLDKYNIVEL